MITSVRPDIHLHFKPSSFMTKIFFYQKTAKELLICQNHFIFRFCKQFFACGASNLVEKTGLKIA